jgi:hypothetical protein
LWIEGRQAATSDKNIRQRIGRIFQPAVKQQWKRTRRIIKKGGDFKVMETDVDELRRKRESKLRQKM